MFSCVLCVPLLIVVLDVRHRGRRKPNWEVGDSRERRELCKFSSEGIVQVQFHHPLQLQSHLDWPLSMF